MIGKYGIVFFILTSSIPSFGEKITRSDNDLVMYHLDASTQILLHAPDASQGYEGGKLYVDRSLLIYTPEGAKLPLNNDTLLQMPMMLSDSRGSYLIASKDIDAKAFTCVCYTCGHRWTGGAFTWKCPRQECGSTNIGFEPNW